MPDTNLECNSGCQGGHIPPVTSLAPGSRLEALVREHRPAVVAYARRRVDPATADDIVAETFLACWRRLDDVPDDPLPWLLGVARRCLGNRRRADGRAAALAERAAAWGPPSGGRDVAESVAERDHVLRAFAALSEQDREVLALTAWEGLDTARAAAALGCSRPALKVRLHRARRRLAERLAATDAVTSPSNRLQEST